MDGYDGPAACHGEPQQRSKETELNKNESTLMKKLIVFSVALLIAGAVSVRAAEAKENWEKNCAKCHGADGKGKTKMGEKLGVKDYTDAKVQAAMKDEAMTKAIKEGVKEGDKHQDESLRRRAER